MIVFTCDNCGKTGEVSFFSCYGPTDRSRPNGWWERRTAIDFDDACSRKCCKAIDEKTPKSLEVLTPWRQKTTL